MPKATRSGTSNIRANPPMAVVEPVAAESAAEPEQPVEVVEPETVTEPEVATSEPESVGDTPATPEPSSRSRGRFSKRKTE